MRSSYIGLPVRDVGQAAEFFARLGFTIDDQVSDDSTAAVVVSESTMVMLHDTAFFAQFTGTTVADPEVVSEVSIGLSADDRAEVDELTERAVAAGGQDAGAQDLDYMYMRAFRDLDGHRWSFITFTEETR